MAKRFITKENGFTIATSPDFTEDKGRDYYMDQITEWFKMNKDRYKIVHDSTNPDEDAYRIIRFQDRDQHWNDRVFSYYIETA